MASAANLSYRDNKLHIHARLCRRLESGQVAEKKTVIREIVLRAIYFAQVIAIFTL